MKSTKEPFGDPRLLGKKTIVKAGWSESYVHPASSKPEPMAVASGAQSNREVVRPAPEVAPRTPEAAPLPVENVLNYNQIVTEWAKKNEFHRQTEALAKFLAEGGQELIAAYGAQKVADALRVFWDKPVDERTGLYTLIRALEPNVKTREKLYAYMEQGVDQAVDTYKSQLEALKTKEARAAFRAEQGGDYAPTEDSGRGRRAHIADYRTFDRNAFSVIGGVTEALRPSVAQAKLAAQELQRNFDSEIFTSAIVEYGSLEKYLAARLVHEEMVERHLQEQKDARLKQLDREFTAQHNETEAMYKEKFAEIEEEEHALFGEHPFLISQQADIEEWREDAMQELLDRRLDIFKNMTDAVRAEFPSSYAVIDAITTPKKKAEAEKKFREELAEEISTLEAPFLFRLTEIDAYAEQLTTPRVVPNSDAVKAARAVLKEKKAAVEREVQERTNAFSVRVIAEIKKLKSLDVNQDR